MNKKVSSAALLWGLTLFVLLLFYRNIFSGSFSKFVLVFVVLAICLLVNKSDLLSLGMFMIPLSCGIPGGYIFLTILVFTTIKNKMTLRQTLPAIMLILLECVSLALVGVGNISNAFHYFTCIFYSFLVLLSKKDGDIDYRKAIVSFVLGCSIMMGFIMARTFLNAELVKGLLGGYHRLGYTNESMTTDSIVFSTNSNTIGFYAVASVGCSLFLLKKYWKNRLVVFVAGASVLVAVVAGALTVSRTCIVLLAFLFVYFILFMTKNLLKKISIIVVLMVLLSCVFVILLINTNTIDYIISRFTSDNVFSMSGRQDIFLHYTEWMFSNPVYLFSGTGAIHYRAIVEYDHSIHNSIQQVFVCYGVFGVFLFAISFAKGFRMSTEDSAIHPLSLMPLIFVFVFLQTLQFLNPVEYLMASCVCFVVLKDGWGEKSSAHLPIRAMLAARD